MGNNQYNEISDGIKNVLVDLSHIAFFSCKGIGVLAQATKKVRGLQGELKMIVPDRKIRVLLEILGLASILEIFQDEDTAIGSFSSKAVGNIEKKLLWKISE